MSSVAPAGPGSVLGAVSTWISCVHSPAPVRRSDSLNLAVSRCSSPNGRLSISRRMSCTSSLVRSTSWPRLSDGEYVAELLEHVVDRASLRGSDRLGRARRPHGLIAALQQDDTVADAAFGERPLDVLRRAVVALHLLPDPGQSSDLLIVQAGPLA